MAKLPKGQSVVPLPPFQAFLANNIPAVYDNTMSYYDELTALIKYLQSTVVPALNADSEAITVLSNYVEHYFDNLDVQEEINNKLDAMAEDGTLQEIITTYIQANVAWTFDTVADMKLATNLIAGSYAKTLGFHSLNDGGGATYYITDSGTADEMAVIAVGDLYANIVLESVVTPEMFGAYGDKTHDDTDSIQLTINLAHEVRFDKEYLVNGSLSLKDNTHLSGVGTIYQPNNLDEKLINIDGVKHIIIEGLTICNESGQSGNPANYGGQYLIWIKDSSDIVIKNCHFKNAYKRGIEIISSKDIIYSNNTFKNATFDMLMLFPEVENVLVEDSTFDTITSSLAVAYLFATGTDDNITLFDFATRNITVNNCKFLNNPLWEGIDTHACVDFTCTNNYIYNCKRGIMAVYAGTVNSSATEKHDRINISNNTLIGTSASTMSAIICGGISTYWSKNITVNNNYADGWGASATNNNAAIDITNAKYVEANANTVLNSKGSHLYVSTVTYGNIIGNQFLETARNIATLLYSGSWFINFKNNVIRNLKVNKVQAINCQGIAQIEGNDIEGFSTPFYGSVTNMTGVINQYTAEMGKVGNYVRNAAQIPTYYCTDTVVKAKSAAATAFTASIDNGTNIVTTSAQYNYVLCEGEEITIAGAGSGGADLLTIISETIDNTHFIVKDDASTGVTGATITTSASNWTAV